jgi:hypothetical protein
MPNLVYYNAHAAIVIGIRAEAFEGSGSELIRSYSLAARLHTRFHS